MIQIAIVEDEDFCADQIKNYISRMSGEIQEEFSMVRFRNGYEIVDRYPEKLDIIFMDIEMALMDGMEAAEEIRKIDEHVVIIFVTNMAQYAIRGYRVNALDYILKPISYIAFSESFKRAIRTLDYRKDTFITVKFREGIVKVCAKDILWIESQGHRLIFNTVNKSYETTVYSMKEIEAKLESEGFKRCNNGCLVNLRKVQGIHNGYVQIGEKNLQISSGKKNDFMSALVSFMTE